MRSDDIESSFKSIEPPTSATLLQWQLDVQLLLASAGVWQPVMALDPHTGNRPVRPIPYDAANPTPGEREAMRRYDEARYKAVAVIGKAAGATYSTVVKQYLDLNDPGGLWEAIENQVAPKSATTRFNAMTAITQVKALPGESMPETDARTKQARLRYDALCPSQWTRKQVLDELQTCQFLSNFPEDHFVRSSLLAGGNMDPDHVTAVVNALMTKKATPTEKASLVTLSTSSTPSGSGRAKHPECTWCKKTNHPFEKCFAMLEYRALYLRERAEGIRRNGDGDIIANNNRNGSFSNNRNRGGRNNRERAQIIEVEDETAGIERPAT